MSGTNLFGWDTVFVGPVSDINARLATAKNALPSGFEFTGDAGAMGGEFGPWSIVPGGSGQLIHLGITLDTGSFKPALGSTVMNIAGVSVTVEVPLAWVETMSPGGSKDLVFDLSGQRGRNRSGKPAVSLVAVQNADQFTALQRDLLGECIAQYLSAHDKLITFVLARTNPATEAAAEWLHTREIGYVYEAPTNSEPVLAIMTRTKGARHTAPAQHNVDTAMLQCPAGQSAFAISGPLMLQHVIGPALATLLAGSSGKSQWRQDQSFAIEGRMPMKPLAPSGKVPVVELAVIQFNNHRLTFSFVGSMVLAKGETYDFSMRSRLDHIVLTPDGRLVPVLSLLSIKGSIKRDFGATLLQIFKPIGITLAETLAGYEKTLKEQMHNQIAASISSRIAAVDLPVIAIWAGKSKFTPVSGRFEDALIMVGDFE